MERRPLFIFLYALAFMGTSPQDRDLADKSAESAAMYDGAAIRAANEPDTLPAPESKTRLAAELKQHVIFNDHGSPEERAVLDSIFLRMMDSPTTREIAAKFIKADAEAEVAFIEIPNSTVVTGDGREIIRGTRARTTLQETPVVGLNKLFMQYDRDTGAATLAHELLGHALERTAAGDALSDTYLFNTNEEENAKLIGWLVRIELGGKPEGETWAYLQDPDGFAEQISLLSVDYSQNLTGEEMKNPAAVYKKRLAGVEKAIEQLPKNAARYALADKWVEHFENRHKIPTASFRLIRETIDNELKDLPRQRKLLADIKTGLQDKLEYFADDKDNIFADKLARDSDSEYFKQKDLVIKRYRARLEVLARAKSLPGYSNPPPPAGRLTWDQFIELQKKDKKECPFGGLN